MRLRRWAKCLEKILLPELFPVLCLLLVSGCTASYVYTPTIAQRSLEKNIVLEGVDTGKERDKGFKITDADVFAFTNDVKQAWRYRSQKARVGGVLTGVGTLGLSAAATTVAGTAGLKSSGDTIPILTGIGTFLGEALGLVDPGGRAEAYQDGLKLILDAEGEYLESLPKDKKGNASGMELTDAGAKLFQRVNAAIVVVDKALQSRVPTKEEIEAATARVSTTLSPAPGSVAPTPPGKPVPMTP